MIPAWLDGEIDVARWLREAYNVAKRSPDDSTQNGAILLTKDGNFVARGWNRPAGDIEMRPEHLIKPWKYDLFVHAEASAIIASRCERGLYLICPWAPCADCAKIVAEVGTAAVICHKDAMDATPERWRRSVAAGLQVVRTANIPIFQYEGKLGGCGPIIFDTIIWSP